jgi:predicted NUDIX family NTP pyrophosphohydrolase
MGCEGAKCIQVTLQHPVADFRQHDDEGVRSIPAKRERNSAH